MFKFRHIPALALAAMICGGTLHANFTLFDMAKDAMFIAKGEFVALQRTGIGDRLTLRCDSMIYGEMPANGHVTLEAFEPAPADEALGRPAIVAFNRINSTFYFLHHPFSQRGAFYFETDDVAPDGLVQSERALRNFLAINQPHWEAIRGELRKRLQYGDAGYEGNFSVELTNEWKSELLRQVTWTGTWAARDAAKALVDHALFKGRCTVEELQLVGGVVPSSEVGSIGRAYMLELIRNELSAHPQLPVLVAMVRQETSQACLGKLSNLLVVIEDRAKVLAEMGAIITDAAANDQMRCNALQILQALRDPGGLVHVHGAVRAEMNRGASHSMPVLRRAFAALKSTPNESNLPLIQDFQASEICIASWELTRHAWVAFAMIDSEATNQKLRDAFDAEPVVGRRQFLNSLMPENKVYREMLIIYPEK